MVVYLYMNKNHAVILLVFIILSLLYLYIGLSGNIVRVPKAEETETVHSGSVTVEAGTYTVYSESAFSDALNGKKRVVLFFYDSECIICIALDRDIRKHIREIPSNTVILKVDYNTEEGLKEIYGADYQHTFVYLDDQGGIRDVKKHLRSAADVFSNL